MKMHTLGTSGIEASVIGLGTWAIGGWLWGGTNEPASVNAVRTAMDAGINFIDTAPAYGFGVSEKLIARAIAGRREQVVLATKCGLVWDAGRLEEQMSRHEQPIRKSLAPDSVRREVEDSLQRLHTDYIDLYQTHWPDKDTAVEDTMEALLDLKKQGKIRAIGVSNVTVELLKRYKALGAVATDQERYSMLDRKYEADLLPYCRENSIAFLAYSPLAMGLLTGKMGPDRRFKGDDVRNLDERFNVENRKRVQRMLEAFEPVADRHGITPAQLALAWTLRQPGVTHVLVGARNPAQAEENAGAGCVHLSDEDMAVMDQSIAAYAADIPRMSW